ncbi:hypothetical protein Anapl_06159 [Anas platyrhynchos]|uniref:Uncharacterized protein n=1 Tax=Anas platyrhynchos TaxID=8839 RepID=R0L6T8_ANAPL|nr:hypothetical protein Anapl_06159 [Anas platyrhynchos]
MTLLQNAMKEDELIHFLFPQVIHPLKRFDISPAGGYRSLRSKQYPPVPSTRVCRISIIRSEMPFSAKRQTGMRTNLAEAGSAVDRGHAGSTASLLHLGTDISIFWLFQCQDCSCFRELPKAKVVAESSVSSITQWLEWMKPKVHLVQAPAAVAKS